MEKPPAADCARPIYLDHQATTPLHPQALEAMLPYLGEAFGNPHSSSHIHGLQASGAVERARTQVADLIGATPAEVVFTSGATEANNMLLRGAVAAGRREGRTGVVTAATEHRAVLDVAAALAREDCDVATVGVNSDGLVRLAEYAAAISSGTAIASVMMANNEIGVLQPITALSSQAHEAGALFHTDAAQALGKIPIDIRAQGIDLMSVSAHKLGGPMGIGAAVVASSARKRIAPLLFGGGQQGGMRSGTVPVALCVGFGEACAICAHDMSAEARRVEGLRDTFLAVINEATPDVVLNGASAPRLPGNLNLSFRGVDAEALMIRLRDRLSLSSGSACTAESLTPSHVLLALGLGEEHAESSVRISFGRTTSETEVIEAAQLISKAVARLRGVGYTR